MRALDALSRGGLIRLAGQQQALRTANQRAQAELAEPRADGAT